MAASSLVSAQTTVSGTLAVSGGGALVDGDQPAFQERFRQRKDGYGGIENFSVTHTTDSSLFRFDSHVIDGNDDYRIGVRWEKFDVIYVEENYQGFRTFYDGSGGKLDSRNLTLGWFNENLALDRSFFSLEIGTLFPNRPQWKLRYDRNTRDGTKNSIRWGESNILGPFAPKAFIPSYLLVDEVRDIFSLEVSDSTDNASWNAGGRYERTQQFNRHVARRRAGEASDRFVTMRDGADTDLFSGHGYYERTFNDHLSASAGGLFTTIDTNVTGSKIYGSTIDAEYTTAPRGRQAQDVGYYGLVGNSRLKQYVGNLNVIYQPAKYWTLRPGIKYEHLRQDSGEDHTDTDFGGGAAAAAIRDQIESDSRNSWNEFTEELEVKYSRWADVALDARGQWNQGVGNLVEQSILVVNGRTDLARETEYQRYGQRYILNASWYARPGLTIAVQYNYRLKLADYDHTRDSTNNGPRSLDRYPAFIIDQDIESHDGNIRVNWRPLSMLSLVTRYAYMRAIVSSTMSGLPEIDNGHLTRHVITQTATWTPTQRLYFTGAYSLTYDELKIPPHRFTYNSNNDYTSASLGAGYALGKVTDLYLEANHYRADDFVDNSAVTFPMGAGQLTQSASLTWVRRQNEHLIYTFKYGWGRNRDGTFAGLNDFDAQMFYGKVQYKF